MHYFWTADYIAHRKNIPARGTGTCAWFLEQDNYKNWLTGTDSIALWVSGDIGCGKTILSSFIVDELGSVEFRSRVPSTVCYFFCNTINDRESTAEGILQGILHQIFTAHPFLLQKHALPYYKEMGSRMFLSFGTLCDIFERISFDKSAGDLFCIIDGVDECEKSSRRQLIRLFNRILETKRTLESNDTFLKILMMGRPEETIQSAFQGLKYTSTIKLENCVSQITKDIAAVVHTEVGKLNHMWSDRGEFESTLVGRANGSFLWVSLVLGILRETPETFEEHLEAQLAALPATLEGIYGSILEEIPSRRRKMANRILTFLVSSARPLLLWEIAVALAVEPDDQQITAVIRRVPPDIKTTLQLHCGPLLKIVGETVHLVHQSARAFLQNRASFESLQSETLFYHIDPVKSNYFIATTCVRYISMLRPLDVFEEPTDGTPDGQSPQMRSEKALALSGAAFLPYAATYWGHHLRHIGYINDSNLLELVRQLCNEKMPVRLKWVKLCSPGSTSTSLRLTTSWRTNPETVPTICILSRFDLLSVVQELSKAGTLDVLAKDINGYTGLHWAAHGGYEGMVEYLLQSGVDPNLQDRDGNTALHLAAFLGHSSVVSLLLRTGGDKEAQSKIGWTALHAGAYAGRDAVIKVLLGDGGNTEAQDNRGRTPLHITAVAGHLSIIEMLLESGCYRHARDLDGETALHYAARVGRDPIIKSLVQDKNDRKSRGNLERTALHVAALYGNDSSIRMLLQRRLEIEARDKNFRTALHLAALHGKDSVLQVLLASKCDKNPRDEIGWTPLHLAAQAGNASSVLLLLQAGVDCEARDNQERTALRVATLARNSSVVRILLDQGCHGDSLDGQERTAIHLAASEGHDFILELLLQKGCQKIDFRDKVGWTALHAATDAKQDSAMRVLLHYGADANARDPQGDTALLMAARAGNASGVRVLLEGGCDRNARDKKGRTALHVASHESHDPVIRVLLEGECGKELRDEFGWTALQLSVLAGHHSSIRVLLQNGCDGNTRSNDGETALHMAAQGGDGAAIKALLQGGGDIEENIRRITIHVASQAVNDFTIRVLLENGVDSNARDNNGWTALHHVSLEARDHSIRALLDHGADPNIQTKDSGRTAMHHAGGAGHLSSVKLIFEKGGNPKIRDKKGLTVSGYAAAEGKSEIVEYLQSMSKYASPPFFGIFMGVSGDADGLEVITGGANDTESADVSMVVPTEELHEIDTRTPTVSGTNGHVTGTGGLSSTSGYWEPRSPPVTGGPTSSVGSSETSTTYQRREDSAGNTVITDSRRDISIHDRLSETPTTEVIRGGTSTESPLGRIRHESVVDTQVSGGAGSVSSGPQKTRSSRWPTWCLCGKKDDGEEVIPARQSLARR